jgi:hypothetical protein
MDSANVADHAKKDAEVMASKEGQGARNLDSGSFNNESIPLTDGANYDMYSKKVKFRRNQICFWLVVGGIIQIIGVYYRQASIEAHLTKCYG